MDKQHIFITACENMINVILPKMYPLGFDSIPIEDNEPQRILTSVADNISLWASGIKGKPSQLPMRCPLFIQALLRLAKLGAKNETHSGISIYNHCMLEFVEGMDPPR